MDNSLKITPFQGRSVVFVFSVVVIIKNNAQLYLVQHSLTPKIRDKIEMC